MPGFRFKMVVENTYNTIVYTCNLVQTRHSVETKVLDIRVTCSDSVAGTFFLGYISRYEVPFTLFCGSRELKGLDG